MRSPGLVSLLESFSCQAKSNRDCSSSVNALHDAAAVAIGVELVELEIGIGRINDGAERSVSATGPPCKNPNTSSAWS